MFVDIYLQLWAAAGRVTFEARHHPCITPMIRGDVATSRANDTVVGTAAHLLFYLPCVGKMPNAEHQEGHAMCVVPRCDFKIMSGCAYFHGQ
jgi:hypothetical protein